jgi:hypothetical protein
MSLISATLATVATSQKWKQSFRDAFVDSSLEPNLFVPTMQKHQHREFNPFNNL